MCYIVTIMAQPFSDTLRIHRQRTGMTQTELARRAAIHQPDVALIEAGRRVCGQDVALRIATAMKLSTRARREFVAAANATTATGIERALADALSNAIKGEVVSAQAEVPVGPGRRADLLVGTADGQRWIVELKVRKLTAPANKENKMK